MALAIVKNTPKLAISYIVCLVITLLCYGWDIERSGMGFWHLMSQLMFFQWVCISSTKRGEEKELEKWARERQWYAVTRFRYCAMRK